MNVERIDGTATDLHGLTSEEVKAETEKALADPETEKIRIYRENTNRHQRRKDAADARKYGYGPNYRGEWK